MAATGDSASVVAFSGGSIVLVDIYEGNSRSGNHQKLVDYPIYDLRS